MPDPTPDPPTTAAPAPTWPAPPASPSTPTHEEQLTTAKQKATQTQSRHDLLNYLHLRQKPH